MKNRNYNDCNQIYFVIAVPNRYMIQERLTTIGIIPICYWHEYLDLVYLYKCIISNSDSNISIKIPTRETRSTNATNGILLEVAKCKTVSYQNSFYVRVANVWNTLPCLIRETNKTVVSFKFCLMQHYKDLTKEIYNPEDPRTFKSVCVKCHTTRPLTNLSNRACC